MTDKQFQQAAFGVKKIKLTLPEKEALFARLDAYSESGMASVPSGIVVRSAVRKKR